MGGKRQANILSAIIQNFDVVEDAIKSSSESLGSAMRENEVWLDSIQGKIDQFTNAVQTMWSNTLDDSVVKGFVEFGVEIVKIIDKIGLLNSALAVIGLPKLISWFLKGKTEAKTFGDALKVLTFGADAASLSSYQLIANFAKLFVETTKGIPAMVSFGYQMQGLSGAASQLGKGISMVWAAIPGVGKIMLIAAAIGAVVAIIDGLTNSTKELKEKISELDSEIKSIQSELDSLNSELETTQSRMEELLSMDSLSFTEEEELKNLQKQNDELERQIYLLERREKSKQKEKETKARKKIL